MEKGEAAEYYDTISPSYDELYGAEQLSKYEMVKDLIPKKGLILDAGCGTGLITRLLGDVVGVDLSYNLLKVHAYNLRIVNADVQNLPFKDEVFDVIVSFTVLQDIIDAPKSIYELKRVLKKGGKIVLSVLNKDKANDIRVCLNNNFKNLKEKELEKDVVFYN
ncbi:Ubiquinone/menaquinone biosynthesis C-methyltransferase UbiE [Candidatus Tiddalikarchaeum anstoanum]|nr:Ubiquinone/menaquinone biosynthesis C-methyltransferase UbiE [Candidatus Tiddalikarchaeum anstoanum]